MKKQINPMVLIIIVLLGIFLISQSNLSFLGAVTTLSGCGSDQDCIACVSQDHYCSNSYEMSYEWANGVCTGGNQWNYCDNGCIEGEDGGKCLLTSYGAVCFPEGDQLCTNTFYSTSGSLICNIDNVVSCDAGCEDGECIDYDTGCFGTVNGDIVFKDGFCNGNKITHCEGGFITGTTQCDSNEDCFANNQGWYCQEVIEGKRYCLSSDKSECREILETSTCNSGEVTYLTPSGCADAIDDYVCTELSYCSDSSTLFKRTCSNNVPSEVTTDCLSTDQFCDSDTKTCEDYDELVCGDGICDSTETEANCPDDCSDGNGGATSDEDSLTWTEYYSMSNEDFLKKSNICKDDNECKLVTDYDVNCMKDEQFDDRMINAIQERCEESSKASFLPFRILDALWDYSLCSAFADVESWWETKGDNGVCIAESTTWYGQAWDTVLKSVGGIGILPAQYVLAAIIGLIILIIILIFPK